MMTFSRSPGRAIILPVAAVLLAGCSPSGPRNVFGPGNGLRGSGPTQVQEITDAGVPGLYNTSQQPVRLRAVSIVDPPPELHMLNVRAYSIKKVGYDGILGQNGDLPSECPGQFVPRPIGSFIVRPHRSAGYFVVIAFTFSRPGRYHLKRLRISYTTGGEEGWQYMGFDRTYIVSDPPLPGPRPLPQSQVCGKP